MHTISHRHLQSKLNLIEGTLKEMQGIVKRMKKKKKHEPSPTNVLEGLYELGKKDQEIRDEIMGIGQGQL